MFGLSQDRLLAGHKGSLFSFVPRFLREVLDQLQGVFRMNLHTGYRSPLADICLIGGWFAVGQSGDVGAGRVRGIVLD